mmetsp:Transcript_102441/g.319152  ORF Transcript_102441/g.319152 Transcript_102441/m.319152 type:complete len:215 (-) Transcript_102441:1726-2370(-)
MVGCWYITVAGKFMRYSCCSCVLSSTAAKLSTPTSAMGVSKPMGSLVSPIICTSSVTCCRTIAGSNLARTSLSDATSMSGRARAAGMPPFTSPPVNCSSSCAALSMAVSCPTLWASCQTSTSISLAVLASPTASCTAAITSLASTWKNPSSSGNCRASSSAVCAAWRASLSLPCMRATRATQSWAPASISISLAFTPSVRVSLAKRANLSTLLR